MTENQSSIQRSLITRVFLSPNEPRLRSGWRLLIQVILQITLTLCLAPLVFVPYGLLSKTVNLSGLPFLAFSEIIEILTVTLSVFLARRFLDRRSIASLGFGMDRKAILDVLTGIAITLVLMGGIFLIELQLGWLKFEAFAWKVDSSGTAVLNTFEFLCVFIIVGWNEELMSRGYHLQTIASGINLFWGVVVSSIIFGLLHLGNPYATWVSVAGIFFAGLLFAFAYVRTGQLWLPIGLHIGWNFFEGVVFGFPVSGLDIYHLTRITTAGPNLWTGGAFGPEAGLIVLPALAVGGLMIYLYSLLIHPASSKSIV